MTLALVLLGLFVALVAGIGLTRGRLVTVLAGAVPLPALLLVGRGIGLLGWALGIRRRVALENLATAFPDRDEAFRRRILFRFWQHLGRLVVEFLRSPSLSPADIDRLVDIDPEGYARFERAYGEGKGAVVVTAHFGNFELLGSFWNRRGLKVTAITKRLSKNAFNAFWLEQRRRAGLLEVPDSGSIREILGVLRRREVLAIMIDQNMIPRRAVFAPFFGKPAATTPAPAVFAERSGAPVFLVLMHPLPGGRHRVTLDGPVPFEREGDRERDVLAFTAQLNRLLEERVRAEPEHWYWIHRRWKTRPPDESADRLPPAVPDRSGPGAPTEPDGAARVPLSPTGQ
jgi:KDO2-lipid IV(A) lauroyltransferase